MSKQPRESAPTADNGIPRARGYADRTKREHEQQRGRTIADNYRTSARYAIIAAAAKFAASLPEGAYRHAAREGKMLSRGGERSDRPAERASERERERERERLRSSKAPRRSTIPSLSAVARHNARTYAAYTCRDYT